MNTCAIYVRQSVDRAAGIDRQLARCRTLAASRGWDVVAEFEDNAVSAYKTRGRGTAWAKLLESPAEVVVAVNLDRLLRGQADLLAIIATGKTVATAEGDLDLTTADGRFRAELLTSLATFEVGRKRERQTRANEHRVAGGLPVPGKRRYGFEPGNIVERPEEAEKVRAAYRDLLAGRSLRSIANEWGRPPVRIREILGNPSYSGYVVRRGERFEAHESVARIVDRETWQDAQDLLADEARRVSPGPSRAHLLSGIAKCECGASMRALSRYYRCSADPSHATCFRDDLEHWVKLYLFTELFEEDREPVGAAVPLAARLRELEAERTRWTAVAALPGADMAQIGRELARITTEAETVAEQLGRSRTSDIVTTLADSMRELVRYVQEKHAEARVLHEEWGAAETVDIELDFSEALEYFDAQDLDARRGVVDAYLTVQVAKGRGRERYRIESKRTT